MSPEPRSRALFLGASNVRLALPELVAAARARLDGPLDILASHGHGRSYLGPSRVGLRTLPAIACDPFWRFEDGPRIPTAALVADVGNDLVYGAGAHDLVEAVARVVARLARAGVRTTVVGLPLPTLEALPAWRFHLARGILFPLRRVRRARLLADAGAVHGRLAEVARDWGAAFVEPNPAWYGLDPIHLRRRRRQEAAGALLAAWGPAAAAPAVEPLRAGLRSLRPLEQVVLGRPRRREQPSARLADGSRASWL